MKKTTEERFLEVKELISKYEGSLDSPEAMEELADVIKDDPELVEKVATLMIEKVDKKKPAEKEEEEKQQSFESNVASYGLRRPSRLKIYRPPVPMTLEEKINSILKKGSKDIKTADPHDPGREN